MNNPANTDRAYWASEALDTFSRITNMAGEDGSTILGDLLCNLMHWADAEGIDFQTAMSTAISHYQVEIEEDQP